MRTALIFAACLLTIIRVLAQSASADLRQFEKQFLLDPANYKNYENLSALLSSQYGSLKQEERSHIRDLLSEKSSFSKIAVGPQNEPGDRITIKGSVTGADGKPAGDVRIVVFQTDAQGYYAPSDSKSKHMSEGDARLFGVLKTDRQGRFELNTIHPGSYPIKYEGRLIPQHIHFNLYARGTPELKIQVAFDDDPAMEDPHWRHWAEQNQFPVVRLIKAGAVRTGTCVLMLTR
jgi:protocatechuate 3,4-dioxygenase beta subunit